MNVPFSVFDRTYMRESQYKDQGVALSHVYKEVALEYRDLEDFDIMTEARLGGSVLVPFEAVSKWFYNYSRRELFFRSIGLDTFGLESYLESEGFTLEQGKMDFPKDLIDNRLYFTVLTSSEDVDFFGRGATPMESTLDALTGMISREGLNAVHQRFWASFWHVPGRERTDALYREFQSRQPALYAAYGRVQSYQNAN